MRDNSFDKFGIEYLKFAMHKVDRKISFEFPGERFQVFIVGGAALMLSARNDKMTDDIDVLFTSDKKIERILYERDFNNNVVNVQDSFSTECIDRAIPVDIGQTLAVDFFILKLEDIVSSKLYAGRYKDNKDLDSDFIRRNLDWNLMDQIVYKEMKIDALSERRWLELVHAYESYKEGYYGTKTNV